MLDEMARQVGFFYAYNVYEACPEDVPGRRTQTAHVPRRMLSGSASPARLQRATVGARALAESSTPLEPTPGNGDTGLGAPCLGSAMNDYFARSETKAALGIPLDNNFIVLDNGIGFNYTTDAAFVGYVY